MSARDFLAHALRTGALVSGGPVPADFLSGWGHQPFMRGMKAHHWTANQSGELGDGAYGLRSACGVQTVATKRVPLLEAGNLPFCTRCENRLMKADKP